MADELEFPRVLILCDEPVNRIGGGGVTMGNLFRGWPQDRLAQVWAHHRFDIDADLCPLNLRLGAHTMPGSGWVPNAIRRRRRLVKRLRPLLRPGLRLDYAAVLRWAREFGPGLLYSQATPYPMYTWWLPRRLSRDLGIPLVNHIMDDWPTGLEREWPPLYRQVAARLLRHELVRLFRAGACNLAICRQMADEFGRRYGVPFLPFHNVIDRDEWAAPKADYSVRGEHFRAVYLGALAEDMQVRSLRDVALAVSTMSQAGTPISLTVHTGDVHRDYYDQYLDGLPAVSHGGPVARQDLCSCLAAADLLVLPVNFGAKGVMARYSMPTKVPEYMASGAPVLVYAPAEVPPAAYARDEGWGYVVSDCAVTAVEAALRHLMASEDLRARLGRRARELAGRNHDARLVRAQFRALLRGIAAAGSEAVGCDRPA